MAEQANANRDPKCVEAWPECYDGGYDPRCCRFPKECSPVISDEATPCDPFAIRQLCAAPAPLVVNGQGFCGCPKVKGHDGQHEVSIRWGG